MRKLFFLLTFISTTSLFFYSFTQVDLSLTLSRASWLQDAQIAFQYIGYFNRPLSTSFFLSIILLLFTTYGLAMYGIIRKKILRRDVWIAIIFSTIVLTFSYNAFSYDIFNYIFDAKIVTEYGDNPYEKKALDYPDDPMLSFMRWTHRTYPYGPTWLVATAPLSYAGLGYFLPTFFLFKILASGAYLGTAYVVEQLARFSKRKNPNFTLALFALNPLVIIESLVSAHNDILMLFFAAAALLMYVERKYLLSSFSIAISIGIKYATAFMLPAMLVYKFIVKRKENYNLLFLLLTIFLVASTLAATIRTQYQPWYLLYPLLTGIFLGRRIIVFVPLVILSFASLMQYTPYIYLGNWDPPVPQILNTIMIASLILSVISVFVLHLKKIKNIF